MGLIRNLRQSRILGTLVIKWLGLTVLPHIYVIIDTKVQQQFNIASLVQLIQRLYIFGWAYFNITLNFFEISRFAVYLCGDLNFQGGNQFFFH